ncbi:epoxyqueuosine reductase QueH [Desulfovibrio sp. OttesenSCG-928-A18]|nr:epoxyqueuosine reductase QueH [Desulfovibrio sp. OttesenSCG-928-A18]
MRILVHVCCGPCAITVLQRLAAAGHEPACFFFNPNIHPLAEYLRRRAGAAAVAERLGVPIFFADALPPEEQCYAPGHKGGADLLQQPPIRSGAGLEQEPRTAAGPRPGPDSQFFLHERSGSLPPAVNPLYWFRALPDPGRGRCASCWGMRLRMAAHYASERGFEAFSSSLLYSRHQDHQCIKELGEGFSREYGCEFVYEDFRSSWQEGIRLSREWGIYRQQYCGCLFSEYERYAQDLKKAALQQESIWASAD